MCNKKTLLGIFASVLIMMGILNVQTYGQQIPESASLKSDAYESFLTSGQMNFLSERLSLNVEEAPLRWVMNKIERLTKAKFSYGEKVDLTNKRVSVNVINSPLSEVLELIFVDTGIDYIPVEGGYVTLISRKHEKADVQPPYGMIVGRVTDAQSGDVLPGANVALQQTQQGASTDTEGNYEIDRVNPGNYRLVATFIGYQQGSQQVLVQAGDTVHADFSLNPSAVGLNELVVVGYGTQTQGQLTGSVSSVDMAEASNSAESSFEQTLQGKMAGVQVVQTGGGKPGGALNINIRGIGTINSESPLYVIDGVPVQEDPSGQLGTGILNTLNPSDIEKIDVLKDASAAAIYGSRASGGVVLITTKQGQAGPVQVDVSTSYGTQVQPKRYDVLNADEYADYIRDLHTGPNSGTIPTQFQNGQRPPYDTDWQDAIFEPAAIQNYNLNVSGGSERSTYSIGLGYFDQKGTMIRSGFTRYSVRANTQYTVNDNIEIGGSLNLGKGDIQQDGGVSGSRPQIQAAMRQAPTLPIHDSTFVGGYAWPASGGQDANNPVGYANLYENTVHQYSALSSFYGSIDFLENFNYRLRVGVDYRNSENTTYNPRYQGTYALMIRSSRGISRQQHINPLIEQTLTYKNSIGKHDIEVLAGFSAQSFNFTSISGNGEALPTGVTSLGAASTSQTIDSQVLESSLRSLLGRVTYSYDNKYLFTGNIRREESSKLFNSTDPVGVFPSASVGWRVSEEPFLSESSLFSNLKLRAGWGQLGNQSVLSNYPTTASLNTQYFYVLGNNVVQGIGQHEMANPNITWETSEETDIGADIGLLDDMLSLTIDYYNRKTEGLLWQAQVPASVGLLPPYINAGTVVNEGLEFSAVYNRSFENFNLELSGNISTINNEVKSLGENDQVEIRAGSIWDLDGISITKVGSPIGQFYGYVTDGIFQNWDEVYAHATQNQDPSEGRDDVTASTHTAPGDFRFKDLNNDGVVNSLDKTIIGNPIPDFTYGFTANLGYKNFDFKVFLQGSYGNDIFNGATEWLMDLRQNFNQGKVALDRWTPQNPSTEVPRANPNDPNQNMTRVSDVYVENGSYLRVKTLTLGYTFDRDLVQRIGSRRLRVYATARNLFTFTPYSGLEPEIGSMSTGTALDAGLDRFVYPQAKQFMLGVEWGF